MAGALGYAEGTLSALRGASPQHDDMLRDVVALIAYQQPEQVLQGHRQGLCGCVAGRITWPWVSHSSCQQCAGGCASP